MKRGSCGQGGGKRCTISIDHPNGASGACICIFTMRELMKKGGKYGCFSSCCCGLGVAAVIENLMVWCRCLVRRRG
ncbi:MAG: hypothetical protein GX874_10210 [Smithella sp.]|nr:hypothetical protein [Smithella sp.]